jgi:hypothetical protein
MASGKKASLVSQHLERVSFKVLEKYQELLSEATRRRPGIYALYRGDRLYYVGLARDLRSRIKRHLKNRHRGAWDRFSVYLTIGGDHIRELELLLLRIIVPKGNRQLGKFKGAEDLRNRLRRDAKKQVSDELEELFPRRLVSRRKVPKQRIAQAKKGAVLAKYIRRPSRLRAEYKGETYKARVLRNGSIQVGGKRFNSPSMAAYEVIGRARAINGWWFWRFERAPGDWVRLKELRRQA